MNTQTVLVLGSSAGQLDKVREELIGIDGSYDEYVDAAIYTGTIDPGLDRLRQTPEGESERLESILSALAIDVPVYIVPGQHGFQEETTPISRSEEYTRPGSPDDDYAREFDSLEYVPIDDTRSIGDLEISQNPSLLDDGDILLTHTFHPGLFEQYREGDGPTYLSGSGLHGRVSENCLNTVFSSMDLGPGGDIVHGGFYVAEISSEGIGDVTFEGTTAADFGQCDRHPELGNLQTLPAIGCPYCRNRELYFDELLQATAAKREREGKRVRVIDLVGSALETGRLDDDQASALREYALKLTNAGNVLGEGSGGHNLESVGDPTEITDERYLYASKEISLRAGRRYSYFTKHDVKRKRELSPRDIPESTNDAQHELDEAALSEQPQGEWLVFPRPEETMRVWKQVVAFVHDRAFYDARVSTEWTRVARGNDGHAIMVAVPNYFDREDVRRVYRTLRSIDGVSNQMVFKPLLYSMWGIDQRSYREYGLESAVRYDPKEL